jgi:hypothetical protein
MDDGGKNPARSTFTAFGVAIASAILVSWFTRTTIHLDLLPVLKSSELSMGSMSLHQYWTIN